MTTIVWFRRGLRLHDHPALAAALRDGGQMIPFFCFDDRLLHGRHASGSRTAFMLECLSTLECSLRERGSGLVVRRGPPEAELAALARATGAGRVRFSADVTPFARARGERVAAALERVELCAHPGQYVADEPGAILTQAGKPHTVFGPYHRAWLHEGRREVLDSPDRLPPLPAGVEPGRLPAMAELGLEQELSEPMPGGERHARSRLDDWLGGGLAGYRSGQGEIAADGSSRLSPYLRFGCISAREIEDRLPGDKASEAFRRQLCWRDFYAQLLLHHPRNARSEFRERHPGRIAWSRSQACFDAWREGRTGFPLVDAGMRQLAHEGWMHNRARLVVGSFLTKDLGIDWRRGERWFMRVLLDGDEAQNNGNWQWIASVGVDPQPVWRRMYNPAAHQERHDPANAYVRRWVPELRAVPDRWMREPWRMPDDVQRAAGCVIGDDYPEPIVDRKESRRRALERYDV